MQHLVAERALPVQASDGPRSQAHQPPLYYALGALLVAPVDDAATPPISNPFWGYEAGQPGNDNKRQWLPREQDAWPWRGTALAVHLLRLGSVAMLMGGVAAMGLLARALWPRQPARVAPAGSGRGSTPCSSMSARRHQLDALDPSGRPGCFYWRARLSARLGPGR